MGPWLILDPKLGPNYQTNYRKLKQKNMETKLGPNLRPTLGSIFNLGPKLIPNLGPKLEPNVGPMVGPKL